MSKDKLIPELRFPEFEGDGEWIYKRLGETGKIITGKTPSTKDASLWNGEILFITPTDIDENQKYQLVTNRTIVRNRKLNILPEGSIAYTCIASIGKMSITAKESVTNQQINSIVVNANYHNEFIYYSLLHITPFIKSRPATSTLPIVNKTEFSAFRIGVPIPQEQQKIASCLSSLDEILAAHNDKLDALKDHKKGLLQNLFPQEGETVPKLRFPEFEGDGEWVDRELGNEIEYFKGFAFKSKDYTSNGRRIVRVSDMGFDYVKDEDKAIYINEDDAVQYEKWELAKDDLIITTVGSKPPVYDSLVGRTIVVQEKDSGSLLNQNAVCLRAKKIKQNFFNYLFKRNEYINFIESIIRGNANQGSITLENLFKYQIRIPESKEEQQKIASCLSAVDELITAQQEKIDELQQHKKGLMQGLFPKMTD